MKMNEGVLVTISTYYYFFSITLLEYDALVRLGIQDPKTYIRKKFKDECVTHLNSVCVGKNILNQIEATIEETLNSGGWVDILVSVTNDTEIKFSSYLSCI